MNLFTPEIESSAPALARGLCILQMLSESGSMPLEQLSRELNIPKASALRLLTTLEQMGTVRRDADKRYEALYRLQSIRSPIETFRYSLEAKMAHLVTATGCTVEWYEPTLEGMQLIRQSNPEVELCVQARPGFLRDWHSEFEAVARMGHAFASQAPKLSHSQLYRKNGVLESVDQRYIEHSIQKAKAECATYDDAFNTNGVRRFATAAFASETNTFLGVLAIAEVYHFTNLADPKTILNQLKTTLL